MLDKLLEIKNMKISTQDVKKVISQIETTSIPKIIHIAGTNGKGSTLAFLKSILNEHGYKVHRYTSPHIKKWEERIEIADEKISEQHLKDTILECNHYEKKLDVKLSIFETFTVVAFLLFSRNKADFSLIETGLGGRFDATNILDASHYAASIISSISYDHMDILGDTLDKIAYEKAFITRENIPLICSKDTYNLAKHFIQTDKIFISDENIDYDLSLKGDHQIENASLAIKTVEALDIKLSNDLIQEALLKTIWKGRLETRDGIIFDGAHNVGGAKAISNYLKKFDEKFIAIISMKKRKDIKAFLATLSSSIDFFIFIKNDEDSYDPICLQEVATNFNMKSYIKYSLNDAIVFAKKFSNNIIVTGSLSLM